MAKFSDGMDELFSFIFGMLYKWQTELYEPSTDKKGSLKY